MRGGRFFGQRNGNGLKTDLLGGAGGRPAGVVNLPCQGWFSDAACRVTALIRGSSRFADFRRCHDFGFVVIILANNANDAVMVAVARICGVMTRRSWQYQLAQRQ